MAAVAKIRDIMIGFFSWVLFHNLYFLIGIRFDFLASNVSFLILPFAIGLLLILIAKKVWIGVGSATAILSCAVLWMSFGFPFLAFLFPFPVGIAFLAQ